MTDAATPTAALIVIGDEILSGRTKDVNIGATADFCTDLGIELTEVRVVSDVTAAIVEAVNAYASVTPMSSPQAASGRRTTT